MSVDAKHQRGQDRVFRRLAQPLDLIGDNSAKGRAGARRARAVFHAMLAAELNDRGAATVEELYLRLDWFLLPFKRKEIRQIVESARRQGLVAETTGQRDAYGNETLGQWATTADGRKLNRPRALALPDLGYRIAGDNDRLAKLFDVVKTAATALIPLLVFVGIEALKPGDMVEWAATAAAGALIVSVLAYGINGELNLRSAAASWPRFKRDRRERWEYQMSWPCSLHVPFLIGALYVTLGATFLFGLWDWRAYVGEGVAAALAYVAMVLPLHRGWHRDRDRCREEWRRRQRLAEVDNRDGRQVLTDMTDQTAAKRRNAKRAISP